MPSDADLPLCQPASTLRSYEEALSYLYGRINYEKIGHPPYHAGHYRLDRMRQLLQLLGNPHQAYPIVHVAGTKGKGTTSTLIANALTACGLRTGLYTSPHLLRLEERIQVDGQLCTPEAVVELTAQVRQAAEQLEQRGAGRATFFELTTAMGMLHFARSGAQGVVLEVGLGGRLDSTNVCTPQVSVITAISLDHQAQLGDTIDAIAREKAGIIKTGIPVVCVARDPVAQAAVLQVAGDQAAPCALIGRDFDVRWSPLHHALDPNAPRAEIAYYTADATGAPATAASQQIGPALPASASPATVWPTRLLGRHQADNIAAALATCQLLRQQGWQLPNNKLREAIAGTQPAARLEVVDESPLSVIDSAHNPASMAAGLEALAEHFPSFPLTVIFAASRDKDWRQMLELVLSRAQRVILTAYQENPRGLPLGELAAACQQLVPQAVLSASTEETQLRAQPVFSPPSPQPRIETCPAPAEAWHRARQTASANGLVYVTGSFFLAAEIMAGLRRESAVVV